MIVLETYGIHTQIDLMWLHEEAGAQCLTPGFEGLSSPFEIKPPPRLRCPHRLVPPAPGPLPKEAWARICAPIPQSGVYWCDPVQVGVLIAAAHAMIPHQHDALHVPWWSSTVSARMFRRRLQITNLAPLIITDYTQRDYYEVLDLIRQPRTRVLIFSGYPKLVGIEDITPRDTDTLSRSEDEWKSIAAAYLYDWIKREMKS